MNAKVVKLVQIIIRTEPRVDDPREMETILLYSLRSLFGDCETYSWRTTIRTLSEKEMQQQTIQQQQQQQQLTQQQKVSYLVIDCPIDCIGPVRSALTFVTVPHYIPSSIVYCFDVVSIQETKQTLK